MANEVAFKPEYVFVVYDDVLKTYVPELLTLLKTPELKEEYKRLINYSNFENMTAGGLMWLAQTRFKYNILEVLATKPFEYDLSLFNLVMKYPRIRTSSKDLVMVTTINKLISQNFTKKVFIYSYDATPEIAEDIRLSFNDPDKKISLVTGDINMAIQSIPDKITLFILNDIFSIYNIIESKAIEYTDVLVANYGYNYILDTTAAEPALAVKIPELGELVKEHNFRCNMFMPIDPKHINILKNK